MNGCHRGEVASRFGEPESTRHIEEEILVHERCPHMFFEHGSQNSELL